MLIFFFFNVNVGQKAFSNLESLTYFAILNLVICDLKPDSLEKDIMHVG